MCKDFIRGNALRGKKMGRKLETWGEPLYHADGPPVKVRGREVCIEASCMV